MWNELRKLTFLLFTGVTIVLVATLIIVSTGCQQAPAPKPSETASTGPGATETVTITPETPTPTPEVSSTPTKQTELAPYSLSKGRRDPFVPFGTESAPPTKPTPTSTNEKPTPGGTTPIAPPVAGGGPQASPSSVPVQVTGTFVSGGKNWAIITSSAGGGPSFMVSTGDKVGEYVVKSVDPSKVVLMWSGKEYVIKMQSFGPNSTPKGTGTTGETPKEKSLPAPEKPKGSQGQQPQMMPPPGGAPSGGGASGGGTGEGAKTETK